MRLLLDSHALVWWTAEPARLSRGAYRAIAARENEVVISVASIWEIGIKAQLGQISGVEGLADELDRGDFLILAISLDHARAAPRLPPHHGDPFDRMLIAQARIEGLTLVTSDRAFAAYDVPILKA